MKNLKNQFLIVLSTNAFKVYFRGVRLVEVISLEPSKPAENYGRAIASRNALISGKYKPEVQARFNLLKTPLCLN